MSRGTQPLIRHTHVYNTTDFFLSFIYIFEIIYLLLVVIFNSGTLFLIGKLSKKKKKKNEKEIYFSVKKRICILHEVPTRYLFK